MTEGNGVADYFATLADVKAQTVMPGGDVDQIESEDPGWILARARAIQSGIDSRLRKRYAAPFDAPVPGVVLGWLGSLLTLELYLHRGVNPSDQQILTIQAGADRAQAQIKEAADAVAGLYDLPLRADTTATGAVEPATLFSTDSDCFAFKHRKPAGRGRLSGGGLVV